MFDFIRDDASKIDGVLVRCFKVVAKLYSRPGLEVYKTFFMLNSTEHEILTAHKNKNTDKWRGFFL